jgi:hypothetical protein
MRVQDGIRMKLRADAGVWIEQFTTATAEPASASAQMNQPAPAPVGGAPSAAAAALWERRYGRPMQSSPSVAPTVARAPKSTNDLASIAVSFRAISLTSVSPDANKDTAFAVLNEFKADPMFSPDTEFSCDLGNPEPPGTFTFCITVKLKQPLKL